MVLLYVQVQIPNNIPLEVVLPDTDDESFLPGYAVDQSFGHAIIKLELVIKASYRPWLLAGFRKAFHMKLNAMNC
tara:strand:- start:445 stop:669 length:225 start_codon:yes stop_codon:yes gene_type:complete